MTILLAEDDLVLCETLARLLSAQGFDVVCCADGLEALQMARRQSFDALILDLSLPTLDGLDVLQRLRDGHSRVPVLVMTARSAVGERVQGLDAGADDYLGKPFESTELMARLRALIRRHQQDADELFCGNLRYDPVSGVFFNLMRPMDLAPREAALLKALMTKRGQAVPKATLHEAVFGPGAQEQADAIEVLVHRLRKRLVHTAVELMTLRGVGYILIDQAVMGTEV